MKRLLLPLLVCCGLVLSAKEESVIRTLDNRDMKVSSIRALPDGSLEYTMADGKIKSTMPRGKYIYAWIPKPKEIAAADILLEANVPDKAAAAYRAAYEKYKLLGWDVYCIYRESEALARLGRRIEAVRKLDQLKDYKLINTRLGPLLVAVKRLNAQLNIDLGKYDSALALLNEMTMGTDDSAFSECPGTSRGPLQALYRPDRNQRSERRKVRLHAEARISGQFLHKNPFPGEKITSASSLLPAGFPDASGRQSFFFFI